ncbi:5'-methylthioadenosine/S-adenosylhomocysteine nucleosidase [Streptomyces yerevanensis]|uniref:5'-methylthioadenosine/S-adenosylhomocysteine nucleosidase family protein n=1 Tax=Streptomyces yerevanensis TaxID=66378 RepID=UPI000D128B0F|nr:5'-methylthioadenosine/S-adenosylhomocysteine nucleosidase [Streptomyces yerevanensis]
MPEPMPTVAILTALSLEYDAVLDHLTDVEKLTHERTGTRARRGKLPGTPWHVALVDMGEGTLTAATITERVMTWLDPEAVLFVGVAGGLKDDIGIGDVVVATKVYAIHGGKQTPDGFLNRPEAWRASHRLEQAAKEALRGKAHFKPIAVGDVVLADSDSELAQRIRASYNDAVAIEMESSGVAHAVHLAGEAGALIIRGISDKANADKSRADAEGSQPRAAANAARAAVAVLRELEPKPTAPQPRDSDSDTREGPFRSSTDAPTYGGDHLDFRGSTFPGPFTAKSVGQPPHGDGQ